MKQKYTKKVCSDKSDFQKSESSCEKSIIEPKKAIYKNN